MLKPALPHMLIELTEDSVETATLPAGGSWETVPAQYYSNRLVSTFKSVEM